VSTLAPTPLRCTHCGRPVHGTQHTRTAYRVDYYALHGGAGEVCALAGTFGHAGTTFLRLLEHDEVISCAECYPRPAVQSERERRFRPEAFAAEEAGEHD
jgi:hypothetical protein